MNDFALQHSFKATAEDIAYLQSLPVEKLPRIACVVPSFNQGKFLAATLESILAQNYPALEIFVADGGSKDNSESILREYVGKFPHILRYDSKPDGGHHGGVNKAMAATSGDIVAWINSDDLYLPETFWKIATFFYFNRCAFVVFGGSNYVKENLELICEYPVNWSPSVREFQRMLMHRCVIPQPSLFFRRAALQMCGELRSRSVIDYELWMRWAREIPFYYYNDTLTQAVIHDEAITANINDKLFTDICREVNKYYSVVPMNWCAAMAYNKAYGAAWIKGWHPPVTSAIKRQTIILFCVLNLRWLPKTILRQGRALLQWAKDVLVGRS